MPDQVMPEEERLALQQEAQKAEKRRLQALIDSKDPIPKVTDKASAERLLLVDPGCNSNEKVDSCFNLAMEAMDGVPNSGIKKEAAKKRAELVTRLAEARDLLKTEIAKAEPTQAKQGELIGPVFSEPENAEGNGQKPENPEEVPGSPLSEEQSVTLNESFEAGPSLEQDKTSEPVFDIPAPTPEQIQSDQDLGAFIQSQRELINRSEKKLDEYFSDLGKSLPDSSDLTASYELFGNAYQNPQQLRRVLNELLNYVSTTYIYSSGSTEQDNRGWEVIRYLYAAEMAILKDKFPDAYESTAAFYDENNLVMPGERRETTPLPSSPEEADLDFFVESSQKILDRGKAELDRIISSDEEFPDANDQAVAEFYYGNAHSTANELDALNCDYLNYIYAKYPDASTEEGTKAGEAHRFLNRAFDTIYYSKYHADPRKKPEVVTATPLKPEPISPEPEEDKGPAVTFREPVDKTEKGYNADRLHNNLDNYVKNATAYDLPGEDELNDIQGMEFVFGLDEGFAPADLAAAYKDAILYLKNMSTKQKGQGERKHQLGEWLAKAREKLEAEAKSGARPTPENAKKTLGLTPGQIISVYNPDGSVDEGWEFKGYDENGNAILEKADPNNPDNPRKITIPEDDLPLANESKTEKSGMESIRENLRKALNENLLNSLADSEEMRRFLGLAEGFSQTEMDKQLSYLIEILNEQEFAPRKDEIINSMREGLANLKSQEQLEAESKAEDIIIELDHDFETYKDALNKKIERKGREYLGARKHIDRYMKNTAVRVALGVATGMAATALGGQAAKTGAIIMRSIFSAFGFGSAGEAAKLGELKTSATSPFEQFKSPDGKYDKERVIDKWNSMTEEEQDRIIASLLEVTDRRSEKIDEYAYEEEQRQIAEAESKRHWALKKFDSLRDRFSQLTLKKKIFVGGAVALVSVGAGIGAGVVFGGATLGTGLGLLIGPNSLMAAGGTTVGIGFGGLVSIAAGAATSKREQMSNYSAESELINILGHEYFNQQRFSQEALDKNRAKLTAEIRMKTAKWAAGGVIFTNGVSYMVRGTVGLAGKVAHHFGIGGVEQATPSVEPNHPTTSPHNGATTNYDSDHPYVKPSVPGETHHPKYDADGKIDAGPNDYDGGRPNPPREINAAPYRNQDGDLVRPDRGKVTVTQVYHPKTTHVSYQPETSTTTERVATPGLRPGEYTTVEHPAGAVPAERMTPAEHQAALEGSHNLTDERAAAGGSLRGHDGKSLMDHIYDGLKGKGQLPENAADHDKTVNLMTAKAKELGLIDAHNHLTARIDDPKFDPLKFTNAVVGHNNDYLSNLQHELDLFEKTQAAAGALHHGYGGDEHMTRTAETAGKIDLANDREFPVSDKNSFEKATALSPKQIDYLLNPKNGYLSKELAERLFELKNNGDLTKDDFRIIDGQLKLHLHGKLSQGREFIGHELLKNFNPKKDGLGFLERLFYKEPQTEVVADGDNPKWQVKPNPDALAGPKPTEHSIREAAPSYPEGNSQTENGGGAQKFNHNAGQPEAEYVSKIGKQGITLQEVGHNVQENTGAAAGAGKEDTINTNIAPETADPAAYWRSEEHLSAINNNPAIKDAGISNIHDITFKDGKFLSAGFKVDVKAIPQDFPVVTENMTGEQRERLVHDYYLNIIKETVESMTPKK